MDLLKKSNKIKSIPVDSADRTEIQTLVSRKDGAPNFELRKFKIMPGGNIPEHYHSDIEHEQYVLKGGYTIGVGNKTFNAESGDAIFIPAGVKHWYKNDSKDVGEFLCIVPKTDNYETIYSD